MDSVRDEGVENRTNCVSLCQNGLMYRFYFAVIFMPTGDLKILNGNSLRLIRSPPRVGGDTSLLR